MVLKKGKGQIIFLGKWIHSMGKEMENKLTVGKTMKRKTQRGGTEPWGGWGV